MSVYNRKSWYHNGTKHWIHNGRHYRSKKKRNYKGFYKKYKSELGTYIEDIFNLELQKYKKDFRKYKEINNRVNKIRPTKKAVKYYGVTYDEDLTDDDINYIRFYNKYGK